MPSTLFLGFKRLEWWTPITPLRLRASLRRLWGGSHRPLQLFFWLIQPFPWHFPVPWQLSPQELRVFQGEFDLQTGEILQLRCIPLFQRRDTALRSVYRIYEYLCNGQNSQVVHEAAYFFFNPAQWRIQDIPDPEDDNLERCAVLASLIDVLVHSFNWRYDLGLRRSRNWKDPRPASEVAPEWTTKIEKLPEPLVFEHGIIKGENAFTRRNVHLSPAYFYNA